jgi:putative transcriptional regulator
MNEMVQRIAGEITLSENVGASLKKWREIFGITQTELAKHIKVTPSTISDYEGNRRKSPGTKIIKRFVAAICDIDKKKGGWTLKKFGSQIKNKTDEIYSIVDFAVPINALKFIEKINGKIITNKQKLRETEIYGYTIVDSLKAILEMPVEDFVKLFGSTTQRAAIFTNVSTGRSPMVAIRVMNLKPTMVVLHNIDEVDPLGVKISKIEKIPIVTTLLPIEEIKKRLSK